MKKNRKKNYKNSSSKLYYQPVFDKYDSVENRFAFVITKPNKQPQKPIPNELDKYIFSNFEYLILIG